MRTQIKSLLILFFTTTLFLSACKKVDYAFGDIKTPSNLALTATVAGATTAAPNGNGTGSVAIAVTSTNALTYKIDFGDGTTQMVPSGIINYAYTLPDTNSYTITVNAIGTAGVISTISKKIKVYVAFKIPTNILTALTNNASKVWISANDAPGHFGVGPTNTFAPDWYAAGPNTREACAYDDEVTFAKDANNNVTMSVNNKGQSFAIGAATAFYSFSGGDACLGINTGGTKPVAFMNATSSSTAANSTRIQFVVPGNGIIVFGTGGVSYEILSVSPTQISLRNIGSDGNAWYQILKAK